MSSAGVNFIDFHCCNYRKLSRQTFRQVTGQKYTIHNIFLSNYPMEIVSTFCADSAHWRFYMNKRLIKHALFIPRLNSNVLAKQICSLVNSHLDRWEIFSIFFFNFGAKADSPYKPTRVITRQVLTGLTCNFFVKLSLYNTIHLSHNPFVWTPNIAL